MAETWHPLWAIVWRRLVIPVVSGALLGTVIVFLLVVVILGTVASAIITLGVCKMQQSVDFQVIDEA